MTVVGLDPISAASLNPEEFARQIALVRAQRALGDGRKEPRGGELGDLRGGTQAPVRCT